MYSKLLKTWNDSYGFVLLAIGVIAGAAACAAHRFDILPMLEIRSASAPVRRMTITRPQNLKAKLAVSVKGFPSDEGKCLLALYYGENGFNDPTAAIRFEPMDIVDRSAVWEVDGLEDGSYAVVVLHDRNDNHELDQPKTGSAVERVGYSNNARPKSGPVTYQDAAFTIEKPGVEIDIDLR